MTRKQKKALVRILVSAGCLLLAEVLTHVPFYPTAWYCVLPLFACAFLPVGLPVVKKAAVQIAHGQMLDENFLMALASIGAFCIGFLPDAGEAQYAEGVFVMLFYQVGELFESIAVGKSRKSISDLMGIRPDVAYLIPEDGGEAVAVSPEEVAVGTRILIRPGEKIPLDGVVESGTSAVSTVALTGESVPRTVAVGDGVLSGCVNLSGVLTVRVTKPYGESTVSRILSLVEQASEKKSRSEQLITRFARIYTPAVVGCAILVGTVPSIVTGMPALWIFRALEFLVISCPCALVVSVPLSFFGGIGGASRIGILIKGSSEMERLSHADTVAFDKTGTLTEGNFRVTSVFPAEGESERNILFLAAACEKHSGHPVAAAVRAAYGEEIPTERITDARELAGRGVSAIVDGKTVCAGNRTLAAECGVTVPAQSGVGTAVYVVSDGVYRGYLTVSDVVKPSAAGAVGSLRNLGITRTVMLTGDREEAARAVASEVGIDTYRAELLPGDKVTELETLMSQGHTTVFVGDGINDSPVLMRADVGIAMGALGSDAAMEAADVVLMDDDPMGVSRAIRVCRRTLRIVRENVVLCLGVKFGVLILCAAVGIPMSVAVFADVGVLILAILNATRALHVQK